MKYKNLDLINEVMEKIWDVESFVNFVELSKKNDFKIKKQTLTSVRRDLEALQKLCIKLA